MARGELRGGDSICRRLRLGEASYVYLVLPTNSWLPARETHAGLQVRLHVKSGTIIYFHCTQSLGLKFGPIPNGKKYILFPFQIKKTHKAGLLPKNISNL